MRRDIRKRWVAALSSGKYPQGRSQLATATGGFCCLGVLCELAADEGVVTRIRTEGGIRYGDEKQRHYLPHSVILWAGIEVSNSFNPTVRRADGSIAHLSSLNDRGDNFSQIASAIVSDVEAGCDR